MALLREQESLTQLTKEGMEITALTGDEIASLQKLAGPACLDWLRTQMEPKWVDELQEAIAKAE